MDILFENGKLSRLCSNTAKGQRAWGERRNKIIRRRLDQLVAVETLDIMRKLPGRCHELTGNLQGLLSLDLDGPYRLLFRPANDPVPERDGGGMDWSRITAVCICGVEDTHG